MAGGLSEEQIRQSDSEQVELFRFILYTAGIMREVGKSEQVGGTLR